MALRIGHNVEAMVTHRSLAVSTDAIAKSMQRLSSGLRINSAADDAAGLGISERMRAQIGGLQQANRNIQDGISLLQTIDGALNEVHSILQRARTLAVQWNNGTLDFAAKAAIRDEMFALSDEIGRIEQSTQFNGINLLQNASARVTLQIGANNGEILAITLADLMGPTVGNLVRPNTFFALPWVPADVPGFDMHITDVSAARARFGAMQNRLEHTLNANNAAIENLSEAESRIRDVDMAQEMTELTRQQILQRSASTMLTFANLTPGRMIGLLMDGSGGATGGGGVGNFGTA